MVEGGGDFNILFPPKTPNLPPLLLNAAGALLVWLHQQGWGGWRWDWSLMIISITVIISY